MKEMTGDLSTRFSLQQANRIEMVTNEELVANCGVTVVRDAFSTAHISELMHNLDDFRAEALKVVDGSGEPQFDSKLGFKKETMAAHLYALDPMTKHYEEVEGKEKVLETSLFKAISAGKGWPAIKSIIAVDFVFKGGRVRVIDHKAGSLNDRKGAVTFHQEKWALRVRNRPCGHNIWMLLSPKDHVASVSTSGIQFALGEIDFWRKDHSADYESSAQPRISRLNAMSRKTAECRDEFVEAGDYVLYRPHLRVGDIVVFDHHVLHASFVPSSATSARVSCDIRAYPKHETSDS